MSNSHLDLDQAIDHVASHMTRVDDDPLFAQRIVASLPDRPRGWMAVWRLPLGGLFASLAMLAIIVTAAAVWSGRDRSVRSTLANAARPELSALVATVNPVTPVVLIERPSSRRPEATPSLHPDHERSLAALAVSSLSADALPAEGALTLESLSVPALPVADLALTAESFPQR